MSSSESAVEWLLRPRSKSMWRPGRSSVLLLFVLAAIRTSLSADGHRHRHRACALQKSGKLWQAECVGGGRTIGCASQSDITV